MPDTNPEMAKEAAPKHRRSDPEGIEASNKKAYSKLMAKHEKKMREKRAVDFAARVHTTSSLSEYSQKGSLSERIDFLQDSETEMTWGRRIALRLMKNEWYYPKPQEEEGSETPSSDDDEGQKPSLARAWAYFEHVALERYIVQEKGSKSLERAEPGERFFNTKLYNPFCMAHNQVGFLSIRKACLDIGAGN